MLALVHQSLHEVLLVADTARRSRERLARGAPSQDVVPHEAVDERRHDLAVLPDARVVDAVRRRLSVWRREAAHEGLEGRREVRAEGAVRALRAQQRRQLAHGKPALFREARPVPVQQEPAVRVVLRERHVEMSSSEAEAHENVEGRRHRELGASEGAADVRQVHDLVSPRCVVLLLPVVLAEVRRQGCSLVGVGLGVVVGPGEPGDGLFKVGRRERDAQHAVVGGGEALDDGGAESRVGIVAEEAADPGPADEAGGEALPPAGGRVEEERVGEVAAGRAAAAGQVAGAA
mmetsp:Transcript_5878/g.18530  ORF Transcript_5878/g.18530 Transcript_5878/m.18530 type:complete len:290 (-) Transcript_5878:674-1543(-)